ncbi:hypothetical protein MKX01_013678 [Papaver californicum]|nr:hypothetical protein MKX01_013678 [Papaver californicum]
MEIPSQYKATLDLNLLGSKNSKAVERIPLPPPLYSAAAAGNSCSTKPSPSPSSSFKQSSPPYSGHKPSVGTAPPASFSDFDNKACSICLTNPKDMAFGCGHQTCCECGQDLQVCPICRTAVQTRIKLYG